MHTTVKRLLKNGEILGHVTDLCDGNLQIMDADGTCVYDAAGTAGSAGRAAAGPACPVVLGGEIVCLVTGTPKAAAAAALITAMLAMDEEKRDLARDTLSKYREINL
ncbi:MAG TPA: hypothetical protein VIH45_07385, partial [Desulfuromonadaceae bacterium]